MLEQLIEQTGRLYDWLALLLSIQCRIGPTPNGQILFSINYRRAFSLERPTAVFNSNAVLDKSDAVKEQVGQASGRNIALRFQELLSA
jgi:hypothetical protein